MLRSVIALCLAVAPAAAAFGQGAPGTGAWAISPMPNGCMVQATSPKGTMLSIWGLVGEKKLGFLLQNRGWDSLSDGQHVALSVEFPDARAWPVEATARAHIDQDGPGLFFSVEPGRPASNGFLSAFTSSEGMAIRQAGHDVDTLPLEGSKGAIGALAHCLSERWKDAPAGVDDDADASPDTGDSI